MKNDKVIFANGSESATYKENVSGWISRDGTFWGEDEEGARAHGSTHRRCGHCGNIVEKYSYCKICDEKEKEELFKKMPEKIWNGKGVLYSRAEEWFYREWDGTNKDGERVSFRSMKFVFCEEAEWPEICEDSFYGAMSDGTKSTGLSRLVSNFNNDLKHIRTNSFLTVDIRAVLRRRIWTTKK